MAASKRKSTSSNARSTKRQKQATDDFFSVKAILQEEHRGGKRYFYVDWEGIDPKTNKPYKPEWIPEEWATVYLVTEWENSRNKAGDAAGVADVNNDAPNITTTTTASQPPPSPSPKPQPRRKPAVVESSPSVASQTSAENTSLPKPAHRISPRVRIPPLRSSFDPDEYEHIASQAINSIRNNTPHRSFLGSSQTSSRVSSCKYRLSGFCRDSEAEDEDLTEDDEAEDDIDGSASYIPTTQEVTTDTLTQQSIPSITQTPASPLTPNRTRTPSPSVTIPETAVDTTHDLIEDSQPKAYEPEQLLGEEEIPDTFDTFDTIDSTLQTVATGAQENTQEYVDPIVSTSQPLHQEVQASSAAQSEVVQPENVSGPIVEANSGAEKDTQSCIDPVVSTSQPLHQEGQEIAIVESGTEPPADASQLAEDSNGTNGNKIPIVQQGTHPESTPSRDTTEGASCPVEAAKVASGASEPYPPVKPIQQEVQPQPVAEAVEVQLQQEPEQPDEANVSRHTPEQPLASTNGFAITSSNTSAEKEEPHSSQQARSIIAAENPAAQTNSRVSGEGLRALTSSRSEQTSPHTADSTRSWDYRRASAEQYAQHIPVDNCLSIQNEGTQVIFPTVEKGFYTPRQLTPQSRHDSSQQSPAGIDLTSLSSPTKPPVDSLDTLSSTAPTRPRSSTALMDGFEDEVRKAIAQQNAANPFTPTRRLLQSSLLETVTRSPSMIPAERPLISQVPTSLRTVVTANSTAVEAAMTSKAEPNIVVHEVSDKNATPPVSTAPTSMDNEELSEIDDSASLLNDDMHLQPQEFIVPLPMEGRQANIYKDEFRNNRAVVEEFLTEPKKFHDLSKIEIMIRRLLAIETHVDLLYSEPSPTQSDGSDTASSTQCQHQAQWSCDNSIKFKFLGSLLDNLRNRDMNVVLAIEKDNKRLFAIIETFLRGKSVNFKLPTSGIQSDPTDTAGNLLVTVLSDDVSPIVQPPDLIVLLDGHFDAERIRSKNWAANPEKSPVPILHLVIPRATGHVECFVSKALQPARRLHTIVATLAQFQEDMLLGRAIHPHNPSPQEAAKAVVQFLLPTELSQGSSEWPLPSIGSIKDLVEFQSQVSQEALTSPGWESSATKRPIGDDQSDPAKRMRLTPQTQDTSTVGNLNETTHVSDSMSGTASDALSLQQQLEESKRQASNERSLRRALEKHHKQEQKLWEDQQNRHEVFGRTYASLKKEKEAVTTRLEAAARIEANLREQLTNQKNENATTQKALKELQNLHLQSEDEKIAKITRLTQELEAAKEREKRAVKSKDSTDRDLEYIKDQYQKAQAAARDAQEENDALKKQLEIANKQDPKKIYNLAELHYQRQEKLIERKDDNSLAIIEMLKKQLAYKEEENARLKAGRGVGAGTRAQSVGARTRPSSRAASPLPGNRDRLTNLRNVG